MMYFFLSEEKGKGGRGGEKRSVVVVSFP